MGHDVESQGVGAGRVLKDWGSGWNRTLKTNFRTGQPVRKPLSGLVDQSVLGNLSGLVNQSANRFPDWLTSP